MIPKVYNLRVTKIFFPKLPAGTGEILDRNLGAEYLGGPSIRGWSKISTYMICDRMYFYEGIKKYRPKKASDALDIGTLFHACMAAHYFTGGKDTWVPLDAVNAERPEIAAEVKRLLDVYFSLHAKEERETWDIRAVEHEVIGSMSAEINGEMIEAPVSCRFDLMIAQKDKDQPPSSFGVVPQGVYIVDHKVMARMSQDLIDGYGLDGQFLLMAHLWRQQKLDDVFGKLNGFIINVITKTKYPECKRISIAIDDDDVTRFVDTLSPVIAEMHYRVNIREDAGDVNTWPMNFAVCKNPRGYGKCKFFDLCQSHGKLTELYEIAPWSKPSAQR